MHDLDPATLLFIPRDEYAPINVDPALFESVGEGLAASKFSLPAVTAAPILSSLADPLERLKTLAARLDPGVSQHDLGSRSHQASYTEGHDASRKKVKKGSGGIPEHMGTAESWDAAWEQDLDQRVQSIDRRSIFDAFVDPSTSVFHTFPVDQDVSLPSLFRPETSLQESIMHSTQDKKGIAAIPTESGVDAYVGWNARSVFGSLSHPAGSSVPMNLSKGSADLTFELPPLTKRPRDILDDCTLLNHSSTARLSANRHAGNRGRSDVSPKGDPNMALTTDILEHRSDAWRDAGRPSQQDTAIDAGSQAPAGRPDKVQLTWEMLTATGPKVPPEIPITSPYITEAGTRVFEAVYQKHLDYAFKFRPTPDIITHESLLDCAFLLLSGTPSSIFTFNADGMKFEIADQGVRIEGCSTGSIINMLQDMLDVGTHVRRLVNVAELCIHHPEGMSLTRIAFGRSLSSYLTFLQGTIVALQETSRQKPMRILELLHRTHDMAAILDRLARLCRCQAAQNMRERSVARLGFYLPQGPDLLSMLVDEIHKEPTVSDSLWAALLMTLLDQASKPYRDILSRWLGMTPSAHTGHDRTQLSEGTNARRLFSGLGRNSSGIPGNSSSGNSGSSSELLIFDCHLQQSLQGLDPFGEFFVHSQHEWSWDGSAPIILADPLDYDAEFQMSEEVLPARFLDEKIAEQMLEAGKELQILVEYEPRHPLIAYGRRTVERSGSGLEWYYIQEDVNSNRTLYEKSSNDVLRAVAIRLKGMGWMLRSNKGKRKGKGRAVDPSVENRHDSVPSGARSAMDIDMDQGGLSGESGLFLAQFGLGLYPDLQRFFSPTLNMEQQASDTSLACPEMMAYLLEPATSVHSAPLAPSSDPTTWMRSTPTAINPSLHHPVTLDSSSSIRSRLDTMAPLRILAEQSLAQAISARVLLINTCVLSLYFHDLNLLGHLEIMERFLLMRDGQFVASVGDALFDEETGLLTRSARAALMTGANATRMSGGGGGGGGGGGDGSSGVDDIGASTLANSVSASAVIGAMAGTEAGSLSAAGHGRPSLTAGDRRSSMISNASSATSWRVARQNWPPRSGELEMSLRAVLLDCLHSSMSGKLGRDIQQYIDTDVEHDHSDDENPEEESRSDVVSEMEVEDDGAWPGPRSAVSLAKRRAKHDETKLHTRRPVDAQELEDTLAFAVMEYDDEIQISKDANALEALDFLYLDYKAPRPLRLLFFTPQALGRYRRLFTFQLHLARVEACLKQVYARLRVRHKHIVSASTTMASDLIEALRAEITMLHRFRFEAQQIFDGFRGYVINVAMGVTWGKFMERLGAVQARIEDSLSGESSRSDGSNSGQGADGLDHLRAMHEYHDQVLDQMLMQSLLKRKQAPILKVVHAILNCILRLWQFAVRLPPVDANDDHHQEEDASIEQQIEEEESVERIHVRIARLQSLHEKFRSLCRMLVKVLKVLDERGLGSDNTHSSSGDNFLQQLLLRLDMSGFNDS